VDNQEFVLLFWGGGEYACAQLRRNSGMILWLLSMFASTLTLNFSNKVETYTALTHLNFCYAFASMHHLFAGMHIS
jgi:hypothetical protein